VRPKLACVIVLLTTATAAACSSPTPPGAAESTSTFDSSTAPTTNLTTSTTPSPTTTIEPDCSTTFDEPTARAEDGSGLLDWLEVIPWTRDSFLYFAVHNYTLIREQAGIDPYTGSDDPSEVRAYIAATYPGLLGAFFSRTNPAEVSAWRSEFGFSFLEIEQELDIGRTPLHALHLFRVTVPPETIDQAVRNDPLWSPDLAIEYTNGATIYDWGDYESDLERATEARHIGEAGELTVVDNLVIRSDGHDDLDPVLDGLSDRLPTLSAIAEYQSVAAALDDLGASVAIMSAEVILPGGTVPRGFTLEEFLDQNPMLSPYLLIGIGRTQTDEGVAAVVVLYHDSARHASENAERFCQEVATGFSTETAQARWEETLGLPSIQVSGRLMIAQFPAQPRQDAWSRLQHAWVSGDTLFWIDMFASDDAEDSAAA
jgi:hypothetical protein